MTSAAFSVLGVDVDAVTLERWRGWFAPQRQPFVVDDDVREGLGTPEITRGLPLEIQDTFWLYGEETLDRAVSLTRTEFDSLSPDQRGRLIRHQIGEGRQLVPSLRSVPSEWRHWLRADGDGHRFVWWPDTLRRCGDEPVLNLVADESVRSQHKQVTGSTWRRASAVLPNARHLAGTFADKSGPNCFGTVMAAAGVPESADVWMLREPFEAWLTTATQPGGDDQLPGTVMVWRDRLGAVQHAAVTLGDGWALTSPRRAG